MKKFTLLCTIAVALTISYSTKARAWCSEPSAFFITTPIKPSVPWCVNEWNNTHTCDEWEIQSYYNELENYRREVDIFINDLNNFVDEAVDYAKCRALELD